MSRLVSELSLKSSTLRIGVSVLTPSVPVVLSCCQGHDAVPWFHWCRWHGVFLEIPLTQHEVRVSAHHTTFSTFSSCSFRNVCLGGKITRAFLFLSSDQPVKFVERSRPGVQVSTSSFSSGRSTIVIPAGSGEIV